MRYFVLAVFIASSVSAQPLLVTNSFNNDSVADADAVNQNFTDITNGLNTRLNIGIGSPYNTAIGYQALYSYVYDDVDDFNTAIGAFALFSNDYGYSNTGIGGDALYENTAGYSNTAIGVNALYSNTTGYNNTAIGVNAGVRTEALFNTTTLGYGARADASNQVRLGDGFVTSVITSGALTTGAVTYPNIDGDSGQVLTTDGSGNLSWSTNAATVVAIASDKINSLAIGSGASVSSNNTIQLGNDDVIRVNTSGKLTTGAVTYPNTDGSTGQVLKTDGSGNVSWVSTGVEIDSENGTLAVGDGLTNNTGTSNTATGVNALRSNTSGMRNSAFGKGALFANDTGSDNTASGAYSLEDNTSGSQNTASGVAALSYNTEGNDNTASGYHALLRNSTGDENTAIGRSALYNNTTGRENTAIGRSALYNNTTGSYNTAVGRGANVEGNNLTNATAIGYGAFASASNTIKLGNSSVTGVYTSGSYFSNGSAVTSDERLKTDIVEIAAGLPLINDLNPVAYRRINNEGLGIELGLLAQDVASTLERHGLADSGMVIQPDGKGYLYLRYNDLLAPMIKAIQELDVKHIAAIDEKDKQMASLREQLRSQQEELLAIVQSQQAQIAQLQKRIEHQFAVN